ncbi:unnamed protein product [Mucor hiemalis]
MLILNDINITAELQNFRNRSIKHADLVNDLSAMRVLSISHIFPVNRFRKDLCVTEYMANGMKDLIKFAYSDIAMEKASIDTLGYVHQLQHAILMGTTTTTNIDKAIKKCCTSILELTPAVSASSESSFMEKYLMPFIRTVFLYKAPENMIYSLSDGAQITSTKKPDIMIGMKLPTSFSTIREHYLFFVEVKKPNPTSKYQAEDDYTKVLKHMKVSIDHQINIGIERPKSFGVLCEVCVGGFSLVENSFCLMNVVLSVEILSVARNYMNSFNELYAAKDKKNVAMKSLMKASFITRFIKK